MSRRPWVVPLGLLALSFVPVVAGIARMLALRTGDVEPRFVEAPIPFVLHGLAATVYAVLGAFQFSRELRIRFPAWHRVLGRVVWLAGIVTAGSGLWMALTYTIPLPQQGPMLFAARLGVGAAMLGALVLGLTRILRRDVVAHEAWMIRAYAIALGAGRITGATPSPLTKPSHRTSTVAPKITGTSTLPARVRETGLSASQTFSAQSASQTTRAMTRALIPVPPSAAAPAARQSRPPRSASLPGSPRQTGWPT